MDSTSEFAKVYEPAQVEARLYAHWRDQGYFQPAEGDGPHFTVVLPPPNVTGRLHMGHALTATIEDTLVRWHRMRGFRALWLPGTDHAGIATQVMVERDLAKEGKTRQGIGREAFLERTWKWKDDHGGMIDAQHERLGASLDWSRYRFTMDEVSSRAVREAFCRLYDEGLIENADQTGAYLLERLEALREKHPRIIKEVRGQGFMVGLEFQDFSQTLPAVLRPVVGMLDDKLKGSLSGFVGALLLRDYDVLVAFTEYNRNVIRLEPPLICQREHVDTFVNALDSLLSRGVVSIVKDFVKSQVK